MLFSTHVLSDVERICDHVALLHDGSIVVQGTLENLKRKRNGEKIQIEFERRSDAEACLKKYRKACRQTHSHSYSRNALTSPCHL